MNLLNALQGIFQTPALHAAAWGMAASFALCVLLVLTKRWHGALTMDHVEGVQKFHTDPTPRIGGLPIVLGLVVAWSKAPADIQALITPILFAGLPAFIFGVLEDITKRIGVMQRLLGTMASGLLAWWITDQSLTRVDVWGVDWLLSFTLVSVLFTAFAVGGVANSINIIDGFSHLPRTAFGFCMSRPTRCMARSRPPILLLPRRTATSPTARTLPARPPATTWCAPGTTPTACRC